MRSEKQILDSYKDLIKNVYGGEFLKFSVDVINAWVSKRTRGHIKKILEPNSLETAVMVLANAIYFKGIWHFQFEKKETRDSDFFSQSGETLQVPMMHQTATFRYDNNPSMQILEMVYKGYERFSRTKKVSMVVFLPKKRSGLPKVEDWITAELLQKSIASLQKRKVEVFFPRFSLETEYKLSKPIKDIGIAEAFTPSANFLGMSNDPGVIMIEEIIHKATIDVDEEGTVATAATAVRMTLGAPMQKPCCRS